MLADLGGGWHAKRAGDPPVFKCIYVRQLDFDVVWKVIVCPPIPNGEWTKCIVVVGQNLVCVGGGVLNGVISESDTASGVYVEDNVWNTVLITMSQQRGQHTVYT